MKNPKEDKVLMQSVKEYLDKNSLHLDPKAEFQYGIDCVGIFIGDVLVLEVGLPPVSYYPVSETEHTRSILPAKDKLGKIA